MQQIQILGCIYEVEVIHVGQYHPYGDFFRVFNIYTNDTNWENILQVMHILYDYEVPLKKNWDCHNIASYFEGYCEIKPIDEGFQYIKCEPYDD